MSLLLIELSGILVTEKMPKQSIKFGIFEMSIFNKITFLHTQNTMKSTFLKKNDRAAIGIVIL